MTKPSLEQRVTDLEAAVATLTAAMCRIDTCLRDEAQSISAGCCTSEARDSLKECVHKDLGPACNCGGPGVTLKPGL